MSDAVPRLAVLVALLAASLPSRADDPEYISAEELTNEVKRREEDISRTNARIAALGESERDTAMELDRARTEAAKIEVLVTARAKLFYRLHRNGGTLRYLLGASSPTGVLKRLGELRYLLESGLEARKQAGMRLAGAENALATVQAETIAAKEMLSMLEKTLRELRSEQAGRGGPLPSMASR